MNYDHIQKPNIDLLIRAALDAGAIVSKTRFGEEGSIFINGRRLEDGELEELLLHPKPLTNADRIRAKSDDEMARWLALHPCLPNCPAQTDECFKSSKLENCKKQWLNWLREEAE